MDEFDLIARYFRPLAGEGGLALLDDAACLTPPAGKDIIITKDMLAADVHFRAHDSAGDIAWKTLAVNVSDLNAKGAKPWAYVLGLGLSGNEDEAWLEAFAQGLRQAQDHFALQLVGGDTIKTPGRLTLSLTAIGHVPKGEMIPRSGAKIGDGVFVTGTIGDAGLGLRCLEEGKASHLVQAYLRPNPPVSLGPRLYNVVHAAADISDGLVADLGHITKASGVGARLQLSDIPLSKAALNYDSDEGAIRRAAATAGDDYQLVLTAPREKEQQLFTLCQDLSVKLSRVGDVTSGTGVQVIDTSGQCLDLGPGGYRH